MGFSIKAGRLDISEHPFTTSFSVRDVRLTTRHDESNLPNSLYSTMHECGHGLYEQGLPAEFDGTPLAEAISLGIHESQSRFWENMVGRSSAFLEFLYPKLKSLFPETLSKVLVEKFHLGINVVRPTFIRTEADEVTYNLHVALRYDIERSLFNGSAAVSDLPEMWNEKMKSYLGIVPDSDRNGVLQDVHWSHGSFGYFPTYLLGNLYAAQWLHCIRESLSFDNLLRSGDLSPILLWLRGNIHKYGRQYQASELAEKISGEKLNPSYYEEYLKEKFGALYRVKW
jgi:carboxypeptidase Taq